MMTVITTPLGPVGLLAVVYLALLFANLSRRLCAVTKVPDYHRWFSVAGAFVALAVMSQLVRGIASLAPDLAYPILLDSRFSLVSFHIPLAIGVTLFLALVLYYWRWILREKIE